MERMANLVNRRARHVTAAAVVLFAIAGVFGAGVAKRLDPFGADDPGSESVIADQRLQQAGFREVGVVVLIDGIKVSTAAGRERLAAIERRLDGDPDVASTTSVLSGGPQFISADGDSTYIAVSLEPTSDRARQDAAEELADSFAGEP